MYAQQSFRFQKIRGTSKINILFKFANNFILLQRTNAKEKKKKEEKKCWAPKMGKVLLELDKQKKLSFSLFLALEKNLIKPLGQAPKWFFTEPRLKNNILK